ncbi:Zinc/iron permease [Lasiodiplodia theobromae]|uniref:Zinc transporter ZIP9 n=1 Tax=Lasiodiplodia theobromae TaxID=45133 RepID=A0A5N5DNA2_9PEZI|nr:Zinc/iron permease [Lasiodiplodia theobromae]KAB2578362.1 Zinc transporter ZIP9 [Lasiodiplodia theobromae]KAF4544735.1 Zinc/iron permease [Lasiodiplodia theobromae]
MWNGLFMLLGLSMIMAISSFLAGSLPLSFSMSQRHLRLMSAMGTGVLVGTSLIVIIPEGIETLYTASEAAEHTQNERRVYLDDLGIPTSLHARSPSRNLEVIDRWKADLERAKGNAEAIAGLNDDPAGFSRAAQVPDPIEDDGDDPVQVGRPEGSEHHREKHEHREPHAWVGLSLIFGFILMYLIDALPNIMAAAPTKPLHISLSNLSSGLHHSPSHSPNLYPADAAAPGVQSSPPATTIGLVIHAAADGIALGASSSTSSTKLGLIIFLAIMLHKAPAAFGLTSVLLKQGLSKRTARAHLIVFSLAAPAGAMVTWVIVNLLGRETLGGEEGMQFATGCVLLFSGGTFLYVAMHSMQETSSSHPHSSGSLHSRAGSTNSSILNGYGDSGLLDGYAGGHAKKGQSGTEIAIMVAGMLVPLLTQVGHGAHGH